MHGQSTYYNQPKQTNARYSKLQNKCETKMDCVKQSWKKKHTHYGEK